MPPSMGFSDLSQSLGAANYLADLQPAGNPRPRIDQAQGLADPGTSGQQRISQEDLRVMRDKFPHAQRLLGELLAVENAGRAPAYRIDQPPDS